MDSNEATEPEANCVEVKRPVKIVVALAPQQNTKVLRCGKFIFNNQSGEKGQPANGDFIFVPEAFDFTTRDGMEKILQALNIEAPSFAFRFDANYGLAPEVEDGKRKNLNEWYTSIFKYKPSEVDESRNAKKSHSEESGNEESESSGRNSLQRDAKEAGNEMWVQSILESIPSEGCIFLVTEPYGGNVLSRVACKAAARKGIVSLALLTCDEKWSVNSISYEDQDPGDMDTKKQSGMIEHIYNNAKKKSGLTMDPDKTPHHSCNESDMDTKKKICELCMDPNRQLIHKDHFVPSPLNEKSCTTTPVGEVPSHAIRVDFDYTIHESKIAKYKRKGICIPGILADECSHCLVFEERTTLLHFKNVFTQIFKTGVFATGDSLSEMQLASNAFRNNDPLFILADTGPVPSIAECFVNNMDAKTKKASSEVSIHDLKVGEFFGNAKQSAIVNAYQLITEGHLALQAPKKNKDYIILNKKEGIVELQKQMNFMMSSSIDLNNYEHNGKISDIEAVKFCVKLSNMAERAQAKYFWIAVIIQVINEMAFFLSVLTAVLAIKFKVENSSIPSIIAVFVLTVFCSLDQYLQPLRKHANLLITKARLESEQYKFRTKTGVYSTKYSIAAEVHPRELYLNKCKAVFDECMASEMRDGYMKLCCFSKPNMTFDDEKTLPLPVKSNEKTLQSDENDECNMKFCCFSKPNNDKKTPLLPVKNDQKTLQSDDKKTLQSDDKVYGAMPIEDYIKKRLEKNLTEYEKKASTFAIWRNVLNMAVFCFTAASTVVTTLDFQMYVPLMLALGTIAKNVISLFNLETRTANINQSFQCLVQAKLECQKCATTLRVSHNKDAIVKLVEKGVLMRHEKLAQQTLGDTNIDEEGVKKLNIVKEGDSRGAVKLKQQLKKSNAAQE